MSLSSNDRAAPGLVLDLIMSVGVRYIGVIEEAEDRGVGADAKVPGDSAMNCMEAVDAESDLEASKSQGTPCLVQFPQAGCTSSHCIEISPRRVAEEGVLTLIFLFLQR